MTTKTPPFLMWWDDSPKHTLAQKIADACDAYSQRFGVAPSVVLVSTDDEAQMVGAALPSGVTARAVTTIRRNTVWAGRGKVTGE